MTLSGAGTLRIYMFSQNSNLELEKLLFAACMCLPQVKTLQRIVLWGWGEGDTWK
jgi:hypothetical protein